MQDVIIKPHKNRRRYSIEVDKDGEIIVRTPLRASNKLVQQLVTNNDHWIQRQQKKIKGRRMALKDWENPNLVFLHGEKYHVFESDTQVVIIEKNRMHVPDGIDHATILRDNAQRYLPERCLDVADMMGLSIAKVRLRRMKSCWGTCSKNGVITLNTALIQVPIWVSDYVMIHECAHLVHFVHSKAFWALVAQYCDSVSESKKWLKEHQVVLV